MLMRISLPSNVQCTGNDPRNVVQSRKEVDPLNAAAWIGTQDEMSGQCPLATNPCLLLLQLHQRRRHQSLATSSPSGRQLVFGIFAWAGALGSEPAARWSAVDLDCPQMGGRRWNASAGGAVGWQAGRPFTMTINRESTEFPALRFRSPIRKQDKPPIPHPFARRLCHLNAVTGHLSRPLLFPRVGWAIRSPSPPVTHHLFGSR